VTRSVLPDVPDCCAGAVHHEPDCRNSRHPESADEIRALHARVEEARRLIAGMHRDYCRAMCPGHWSDDGRWIPSVHEATCQEAGFFLAEPARSDSEPAPQNPKGTHD
jgi:hypothetical protein